MKTEIQDLAHKYLRKPWERLTEREKLVLDAVAKRLHISRPMHKELDEGLTFGQRMSDRIADFGGSWTFIGSFFFVLFAWIALNSFALFHPYDPYPYILLNLVLSCLAAVQAPLILMSQNRQEEKDRIRAAHDYEVNLKAEIEIMQLHEKIDILLTQDIGRVIKLQESQNLILESLAARIGGSLPAAGQNDNKS
jgi:uncharacterized membrane protein